MPQNYFITGLPKAGKTVLLRRLIKSVKARGLRVGGLISPEERHHGTRTGFYVKDVSSGRIGRLADVDADGPKVSKYHVDLRSFESIALPAMKACRECDVVFIDEIGPMELKSLKFSDLLDSILESGTPVIASLHTDLAPKYGFYGEVLLLAENNREAVYTELMRKLNALGKRPAMKKAQAKKPAAAKAKVPRVKAQARKKAAAPAAKAKPLKKGGKKAEKAPGKKAPAQPKAPKEEPPKKRGGLLHKLRSLLHG